MKVIRGAQNILILFGVYWYEALLNNSDILDLQEIFEFKRDALRYFALNNWIVYKLQSILFLEALYYIRKIFYF